MRAALALILAVLCGPLLAASVRLPKTLEEAIALGKADKEGAATKQYHDATLMPYFDEKYARVLKHCFETVKQPDARPIRVVVAIDWVGKVLRTYRDHETNIFSCLDRSLVDDTFPRPPVAVYFLYVDLPFKDRAGVSP
jgi:hypothetical protein